MAKDNQTALAENAYARKALDAIAAIDRDAQKKKFEQVNVLKEALKNIDQRMSELQHQRQQVDAAIRTITGSATTPAKSGKKRQLVNRKDLQDRIVRWMSGRAGTIFTGVQLREEFPELQGLPSIAALLKESIASGAISIDKSGGNRNTTYSAPAKQA